MGGEGVQEEVAVIRHHFQGYDAPVQILDDLADEIFQPFGHLADEHPPSIPWAKDEVVVDQRDRGCGASVLLAHSQIIPSGCETGQLEGASSHT